MKRHKTIGVDEAGRGPLAGPVVASAVYIKRREVFLKEATDSKKLTENKREELYEKIINSKNIVYSLGIVEPEEIDRINILEATKKAIEKAVIELGIKGRVVIDGNFGINTTMEQRSLIGADKKIIECSVASILAKVERDRIMRKFDTAYPQYGFGRHKGYGTKLHRERITKHGVTPIHRKSFTLLP